MRYYHVLVNTQETGNISAFDITDYDYILDEIVIPHLKGKKILLNGYSIKPSEVKRFLITYTAEKADSYVEEEYKKLQEGLVMIITREECVFSDEKYVNNITNELLKKGEENMKISASHNDKSNNKEKIFLAYSYRHNDDEFVTGFKDFLVLQGYEVLDGKADRLGSISTAILDKIRLSDICAIVMTKRDKKENGKYTVPPWLLEEKGAAKAYGKRVALFVEDEIDEADIGGIQGDDQRFPFTRNNFMKVATNFIRIIDNKNGGTCG